MSSVRNKKRIFIDFDGTIVDIKNKYCELYKEANKKFNLNIFNNNIYWKYKRNKISEKEILFKNNINLADIDRYLSFRTLHIEDKRYLAFDKLIISEARKNGFKKNGELYLITLRKNKNNLFWELKKLGIKDSFKEILCREDLGEQRLEDNNDEIQKKKLLNMFYPFRLGDILIGDTEVDYSIGVSFKIQTFLVNTGLRDEKLLKALHPKSIIYKSINNVFSIT